MSAGGIATATVVRSLIPGEGPAPALLLPDGAYLAESGGAWVFVQDGSEARQRMVVLGRHAGGQVEVLSGLAPGERVIVSSYAEFGDASRLRLVD